MSNHYTAGITGTAAARPSRIRPGSMARSSGSARRPALALPTNPNAGSPTRTRAGSSPTACATRSGSPSGPGTSEVWLGDVGWNNWEEINRIPVADGRGRRELRLALLRGRRRAWRATTPPTSRSARTSTPRVRRRDRADVTPTTTAPGRRPARTARPAASSISGMAFYPETGGTYPGVVPRGLFFADYSRNCIWVMFKGSNGLPDPDDAADLRGRRRRPGGPRRSARAATCSTSTSTAARSAASAARRQPARRRRR